MKIDDSLLNVSGLCDVTSFQFEEVILSQDSQIAATQLAEIARKHSLHHLTSEDLANQNQRAKVEAFPNYIFLVWHYFQLEIDAITEFHFVISEQTLLLVTNHAPVSGGTWRDLFFGAEKPLPALVIAIHHALDRCVDDAERFLDALNDAGTEFESAILDKMVDPREILILKKHTIGFERAVANFGSVLNQLVKHLQPSEEIAYLFRDVADHVKRMQDDAEHLRLQLFAMLDVYWGAMGSRSNVQMRKLTTLATLFLPINLWTGAFGMNFETMPFASRNFFLIGVGLMVVTFFGVCIYMYQRGLIRSRRKPFKFKDAFPTGRRPFKRRSHS